MKNTGMKLVDFNENLDLTTFYKNAEKYGYVNNSNQHIMIDCFKKEREYKAWILYRNENPIGSVVSHSLDFLGDDCYRICVRTCAFKESRITNGLLTLNKMITEHQHVISQFYIPANIQWCGHKNKIYISTHNGTVGSQKHIHNLYCPHMEKLGIFSKEFELEYRGYFQTFWRVNVEKFFEEINKYPRWIY